MDLIQKESFTVQKNVDKIVVKINNLKSKKNSKNLLVLLTYHHHHHIFFILKYENNYIICNVDKKKKN